MIPEVMEARLSSGRLDVGFTVGGGGAPGVEYHALGSTPGYLVCGRSHPLYESGLITVDDLSTYPSVVPSFFDQEHLPTLDQFPDAVSPRRVGATIELLQMAVQLCQNGTYLGFFPEISVCGHLDSGALRRLDGLNLGVQFELQAITNTGATVKAAARLLIEDIRDRVG